MWPRVREMLRKEFILVLRDPKMRGVVFVMPIIQLLVIGYAVSTDVRHVKMAVYDLDHSADSRDLLARFAGSGYFDFVEHVSDEERLAELMDGGTVTGVLRIDAGFQSALRAGRPAPVQLLVDGTDANTARIILDYGARIGLAFSEERLAGRALRRAGAAQLPRQVDLRTRAWFNPDLESRNYYLPGVMVLIVTVVTVMLTSMAVVREREIGTIEQVMVTPITRGEFILGKTAPFALIGMVDVALVALVGALWFHVPIRGSLLLLFGAASLYLLTTIGIGLLISTICHTQQQAMMSVFFFIFPAVLLSGFMFPIANMPEPIQWVTYADPLRYFLVIVRGIFLKGVGASVLWPELLVLGAMGTATLWLAARSVHKTLA